jgi:hypothetical protein
MLGSKIKASFNRWCIAMAKKSLIPGLSFSWKRALGITSAKQKVAKATGIPTTKAGRRNKLGKLFGIK